MLNMKESKTLIGSNVIFVIGMLIVNFLAGTCFSLLAPFFPEMASKKGASSAVMGVIFGLFPLMRLLLTPVFGYYISTLGVKFTFVCGSLACGICGILFGVLDKCPGGLVFILMCFLCRIMEGIGQTAFCNAHYVIIMSKFPERKGTIASLLQAAFATGVAIGPPLGGIFYELGGYGLPFYVTGGALTISSILSGFTIPSVEGSSKKNSMSSWKLIMHIPILIVGSSVSMVLFAKTFIAPILTPHLLQFNLTYLWIGFAFIVNAVVAGVTMPLFGWLCDKMGFSSMFMSFGLLMATLAYILIGPAPFLTFIPPSLGLTILSLCFLGLAEGLIFGPAFTCICKLTKENGAPDETDTYGIVASFLGVCLSLGLLLGPIVGGALFDAYGFKWAAFLCSILSFIFCLVLLLYKAFDRLNTHMQFKRKKLEEKSAELKLVKHDRLDKVYGYKSILRG